MLNPVLLLPDLLLIATGYLLCRYTRFNRPTWDVVEHLVYWLLFPALLFASIVNSPIQLAEASALALGGAAVCLAGILMASALRWWPGVDLHLQASGAQVAFRFNSYIALALADRLYGAAGLSGFAVLIAVCVPLCNAAAVWSLARRGGQNVWREMARNPLIIATVSGLLIKVSGLHLPGWGVETVARIGQAALPMGLLAVGAGLKMAGLRAAPGLAAALLTIRHAILPMLTVLLGGYLPISTEQHGILVAFASLPTASSAYVLAMRMGGNGPFVAGLITLSTLIGMAGVPLWVAVFQHWH
jgi:malonate transporter and related proteins